MPTIRTRVGDFFVDEVVPPRTAQQGEHLHVRIEKCGISTEEAVRRMSMSFGVPPKTVGRCGRKDVRAVTRQWLSFVGASEKQVEAFDDPDIEVLEYVRLPRKLRMGRFLGNRFRIRIREVGPEDSLRAREGLERVQRLGLRNAFGEQRLGKDDVNARIGRHLIRGGASTAVELHLENNTGRDAERMRRHLDAGRASDALRVLGRRRSGFYVSAWQADVFNRVLERRGDDFSRALDGDLFHQHSSSRVLRIDDPEEAVERVSRLECSPTGPLPGPSMRAVSGAALEIEGPVLVDEGAEDVPERRWFGSLGARRPLRAPVTEAALTEDSDVIGTFLEVSFRLPPGAFATTLIRELMGSEVIA